MNRASAQQFAEDWVVDAETLVDIFGVRRILAVRRLNPRRLVAGTNRHPNRNALTVAMPSRPIKVVTVPVPRLTGHYQHQLRDSVADSPSVWTSKYPIGGNVESSLCGSRGRVFFHAEPA